nr:DNA polymerase processivity subunit UL42 [Psittacid alphaherpesvirus 6]
MAAVRIRLHVENNDTVQSTTISGTTESSKSGECRSTSPTSSTDPTDVSNPPIDADIKTTDKIPDIIVSGEPLQKIISSLKSIIGGLKNVTFTFFDAGVIVQGQVCGQRLFLPLPKDAFTAFKWVGEPAVFLSTTDSKRTLLDAFRYDKKRIPTEVTFTISGCSPERCISQTVIYRGDTSVHSVSAMKYELWSSRTLYPFTEPQVSFSLSKQQMGKVASIAGRVQHEALTFGLKPEGGFYVGTILEVVRFEVESSDMIDYPYSTSGSPISSSSSILRYFSTKGIPGGRHLPQTGPDGTRNKTVPKQAKTKPPQSKAVVGFGSGKPFCLALENTISFKTMLQKIRTGADGMTLSFYPGHAVPVMSIRLHTQASPTVFLFCTADCISISDLESVSAVSGSLDAKKGSPRRGAQLPILSQKQQGAPKKRASTAQEKDKSSPDNKQPDSATSTQPVSKRCKISTPESPMLIHTC